MHTREMLTPQQPYLGGRLEFRAHGASRSSFGDWPKGCQQMRAHWSAAKVEVCQVATIFPICAGDCQSSAMNTFQIIAVSAFALVLLSSTAGMLYS